MTFPFTQIFSKFTTNGIGRCQLVHAECISAMQALPDSSVDVVICDLPYGTTQNKWDTQIDLNALWMQYLRICKGTFVLHAQAPFDKVLAMSRIELFRYEWIWEKSAATGHLNAKRAPMKAHENVLVFADKSAKYNPIKTTGHVRKTSLKRGDDSTTYGVQNIPNGVSYDSTERFPRSVLRFASDKQKSSLHPTQKPLALAEYLVLTHSDKGDVVLDNAMGSGTTGIACMRHGRKFIGMENNAEHFNTAVNRIRTEYDDL